GYDMPSVGPDGTIYIGSGFLSNPLFYALNPDGTYKWTTPVDGAGGWVGYTSATISGDGNTVFTPSGQFIYALSAGHDEWKFDPGNTLGGNTLTLSANGLVYFTQNAGVTGIPPGTHGYLYALRASDRALIWSYDIGSSRDAPVIASDGTLYVVGDTPEALGS